MGEQQRPRRLAPASASPVLLLQPDHALAEGIHQVVMGAGGKAEQFALQRLRGAVETHLPRFKPWGHGMGAAHLAALRPDGDQPGDLAPEQLTHRRAIGGVFD